MSKDAYHRLVDISTITYILGFEPELEIYSSFKFVVVHSPSEAHKYIFGVRKEKNNSCT